MNLHTFYHPGPMPLGEQPERQSMTIEGDPMEIAVRLQRRMFPVLDCAKSDKRYFEVMMARQRG